MSPFVRVLVGLHLFPAALASCLTDAIPVAARKPLKGPAGSYPLGVWVNDWAAGHLVAEMMTILMEEMMGYLVELKGPGGGTPDGFFALTGCRNPTNSDDRQCEGVSHTRVHVNVEGWTVGYKETWDRIQQDFTALAPRNLGNAGYRGIASVYLFSSLKDRVYEAAGISLEYYREYNASWKDLSPYFTSLHAVNTSRLHPCNATNLMDSAQMQIYVDATGDWDGVAREGSKVYGKCWQQHFWVPPACRSDISRCFVFFTGGSGWSITEFMQKGTIHNMPMAVAVGNTWNNYASLPLDYDSVFYSWQPDTTFLRKAPLRLVFPDFDPLGWSRGMRTSVAESVSINTHVSQDLRALAPDVEELLSTYQLTLQEVNHMMLDQMDTENSTYWDAACRWVKSNRERWRDWLPDKSQCFQGFGIFDEYAVDFGFVKDRSDPTGIICQPCPPGYFSEQYQDDKGITFVCTPCPPGTSQPFGAQVACQLCNAGEHQPESGSASCRRCNIGSYQDTKGQPVCKECPQGTTTLGQGSLVVMECGCTAGSINLEVDEDQFQCHRCGEGLECPFHSSLYGLTQGVSPVSPSVPEILEGYVSTIAEPFKVFKCYPPSNCLRGKPGNCAGGLEDDLCTRCSAGQTWNGETCSKCHSGYAIAWCIGAVFVLIFILGEVIQLDESSRAETKTSNYKGHADLHYVEYKLLKKKHSVNDVGLWVGRISTTLLKSVESPGTAWFSRKIWEKSLEEPRLEVVDQGHAGCSAYQRWMRIVDLLRVYDPTTGEKSSQWEVALLPFTQLCFEEVDCITCNATLGALARGSRWRLALMLLRQAQQMRVANIIGLTEARNICPSRKGSTKNTVVEDGGFSDYGSDNCISSKQSQRQISPR